MILSRLLNIFLRFGQFVCAAVTLGITAYFEHQHDDHSMYIPHARNLYTLIISITALIASLVLIIPFSFNIINYIWDFLMAAAFFAAFGVLQDWIGDVGCGGPFHWGGIYHGGYCGKWRATEAFTFIGACFWLASCILGVLVAHRLTRRLAQTDGVNRSRA